jgi:lipid-A-disaccharide synthase
LKTIKRNFKFAYSDISAFNPDVLILVDFPGFNLRLAKWAKKKGIKVFYYISPTVWAWHQSRVYQVRDYVDKMFVILPFEKEFYKRFAIEVDYEGHPIIDALANALERIESKAEFCARHKLEEKQMIAILPGSRKQELRKILPIMTSVANDFKNYTFVVAGMSFLPKELYAEALKIPNVRVIYDDTYALLHHVDAAIVKSGTSTLETALFNIPQVVCYKTNALTFFIGKLLVKIKYVSLVNIILAKEAIKELLQNDLNYKNLKAELSKILNPEYRQTILDDYKKFRILLGEKGASDRIAAKMIHYLK